MAKIQAINKSRKSHICSKCGKVIEVGDSYKRCELGFGPTIIRCKECGLQPWECTTSEYALSMGSILYNWTQDYGVSMDTPDILSEKLRDILDEQQERLDNMPESLQYGPTGELLSERIDGLESACDELDCIDIDDLKSQALDNIDAETLYIAGINPEEDEYDYDHVFDLLSTSGGSKLASELEKDFLNNLEEAVSDILEQYIVL